MPIHPFLTGKRVVAFDAYGTLLDVHAAVARHAEAIGPSAQAFSETWRRKQLEYSWIRALANRYAPFWELTQAALDVAFAEHPDVDRSHRATLLEAYRSLDAYPDAAPALAALRAAGLTVALFSNGDPSMLADAVAAAGLGERLDAVLSVEPAGTFKTDPRAYALVTEHFRVAREAVVLVSSNRWDVAGARAFGFEAVWVNRAGRPDEYPDLAPGLVVDGLAALSA